MPKLQKTASTKAQSRLTKRQIPSSNQAQKFAPAKGVTKKKPVLAAPSRRVSAKKPPVGKSTATASVNAPSRLKGQTAAKTTVPRSKKKPATAQKISTNPTKPKQPWWQTVTTIILSLAILIMIILMFANYFLPRRFKLEQNTNLLLINTATNQAADQGQVVFLHLNPELRTVDVINIDPQLEVQFWGTTENLAMREMAPTLIAQGKSQQFMRSAYSFALEEALDEVIINLAPEDWGNWQTQLDRAQIQSLIQGQISQKWQAGDGLDRELLSVYFFLNSGAVRKYDQLTAETSLLFHRQNFSKSPQARTCSVTVINSTTKSGLAAKISTLLERDGYLVTRLGNYHQALNKTTIYFDPQATGCVDLVQRTMQILPFEPVLTDDGGAMARQNRAGVVVVAGEDLLIEEGVDEVLTWTSIDG